MPVRHLAELWLPLFGPRRPAREGVPVDLSSHKSLALLAYLTVTGTIRRSAAVPAGS